MAIPRRQIEFWAVSVPGLPGQRRWANVWGPFRYYEIEKYMKRNNGALGPGAKLENGVQLIGRFLTKEEAEAAALRRGPR
jgi:hypothetical protein